MKRISHSLIILFVSTLAGTGISAQCDPDTSCINIENPNFCPRNLIDATVNKSYEAIITVIPPSTFEYEGTILDIIYIEIDTVLNLPPGIDFQANADTFYADTAYCIRISGTPTVEGSYSLGIQVSPTIKHPLLQVPLKADSIVDDTSVVMVVNGASGIDPYAIGEFKVRQNIPNPFSEVTTIGFYTPFDDKIELQVYNILGELMYEEIQGYPPGEYNFRFDGQKLLPGTYFYRVTNNSANFTGKFIKSR